MKYFKKSYGFSKFGMASQSLGEVKLNSTHPRMVPDYDIEEKMLGTLYFTSDMMYDKAYNYISNSIPGSMSQK